MPKIGTKPKAGTVYIGVDPGQSGGIGVITPSGGVYHFQLSDNEHEVWEVFKLVKCYSEDPKAVLEKVHSMPSQGVSSSFKFGTNFGLVKMGLAASDIGYELVDPRTWQKALGIPPRKKKGKKFVENPGQFKKRVRDTCRRMFPKLELWKQTQGVQLAVSDAILMAEYLRRKELKG